VYQADYLESELTILSALDFDLQADVLNVSQELYKSSFTLISLNTTAAMYVQGEPVFSLMAASWFCEKPVELGKWWM
jgi:hypothetical protein